MECPRLEVCTVALSHVRGAAQYAQHRMAAGMHSRGRLCAVSGSSTSGSQIRAASIPGSAAGPLRRGAACSIRRDCRMRRSCRYAAQHLTSIEVNGTFYRTQSPASYRKWASEVPDGFVFSLKGPRFAVNRRVLAEAGDSIKRFLHSGVARTGRPARAAAVAIRADQEIRRGRFRKIPGTAAGRVRRPAAAPCRRGAP